MNHVYRPPFNYAAHRTAMVYWQPQPLWQFEGLSDAWYLYETAGNSAVVPEVDADVLLDVAGAPARRALRHPGWQRKQAEDQLRRDRALEASIRDEYLDLTGQRPPPPPPVPQKTAGQIAAEMAADESARIARQRATELAVEAQRARVAIAALQPELNERRRAASYRVIEQLLRGL